MTYECEILEDTIYKTRLTTFRVRYPRMVHAEMLTHRVFSRNSSSSRAIPIEKMIKDIREDPVIPIVWGRNQKGMQADKMLSSYEQELALQAWLSARDNAIHQAEKLIDIGAHKQIVNRLLEPWMWITVIITATEWENFFRLRCHETAQPEIQEIANMMNMSRQTSFPKSNIWHIPYMLPEDADRSLSERLNISVARCARVSYRPHGTEQYDPEADLILYKRLLESGHVSPMEHQARGDHSRLRGSYNLRGWIQYRELLDIGMVMP